ncbi:MAG: DUF2332 domain-containing protein [Pseudomonadota bacterium]
MLDPVRILDHFREQAGWCEDLGSRFTAELLRAAADDIDAGGPVESICGDWGGNPRKDALGLRLAGALHHATLGPDAPDLNAVYPAQNQAWSMETVWPIARDWLAANVDHTRAFMASPPQTNETRRALALLPGFLELAAKFDMPQHLLELGASAGLNQNWDRYAYKTASWSRPGDSDVVISSDWTGPTPAHLDAQPRIASRAACDLSPVDLSDPDAIRRLTCYTWPDQAERLARLRAAIALARDTGVGVEQADAADWIEAQLAVRPKTGLTVVYHSVFLIYPPKEAIARIMSAIEAAGAAATSDAPVAWLSYESEALFGGSRDTPKMETRLQVWPGGAAKTLAQSDGHITKIEYFA